MKQRKPARTSGNVQGVTTIAHPDENGCCSAVVPAGVAINITVREHQGKPIVVVQTFSLPGTEDQP
jgi:hypothetical protein